MSVCLGATFGAGLGLGSMLMLRAGVIEKPKTIIETKWVHPPEAPPATFQQTPLTLEELEHLQRVIDAPPVTSPPKVTTTTTLKATTTTTPQSTTTTVPQTTTTEVVP